MKEMVTELMTDTEAQDRFGFLFVMFGLFWLVDGVLLLIHTKLAIGFLAIGILTLVFSFGTYAISRNISKNSEAS